MKSAEIPSDAKSFVIAHHPEAVCEFRADEKHGSGWLVLKKGECKTVVEVMDNLAGHGPSESIAWQNAARWIIDPKIPFVTAVEKGDGAT